MIDINTRVYYTGDVANPDGFGRVTAIQTGISQHVQVRLDDGRVMWVPRAGIGHVYRGHCQPRFVTVDAYNAFRRATSGPFPEAR